MNASYAEFHTLGCLHAGFAALCSSMHSTIFPPVSLPSGCHRTVSACLHFMRGIRGSLAGAECLLQRNYIPVTSVAVTALLSRTNVERRYYASASAATAWTHTGLLCC